MTDNNGDERARWTADVVARHSYGKLVAFLTARTRDVAAAEDALSEAFASALANWPTKGCPANPEAWLLITARRKLIDGVRRQRNGEKKAEQLRILSDGLAVATADLEIPDHRLALMFACAHPALDANTRAPLMLQVVLGLDARKIAASFLTSPAAMGKRLVRAKDKIRRTGIPFHLPDQEELPARLGSVLDAVYAIFAEGWSDPERTDSTRRDFSEEAIFLGILLVELLPNEPETFGLLALILHAEARRAARRGADGEYVPLADQNHALWDAQMIDRAERLLRHASTLGSIGRYQIEAALQSAHVHRCRSGHANWPDIVRLYDGLLVYCKSPVVALNRILALAEIQGAGAALSAMGQIDQDSRLSDYQPYWAARAHLLAKIGSYSEARRAYAIAIGLERDTSVRRFLLRRQAALEYCRSLPSGQNHPEARPLPQSRA